MDPDDKPLFVIRACAIVFWADRRGGSVRCYALGRAVIVPPARTIESRSNAVLHHRAARRGDILILTLLMETAIAELQKPVLDEAQIASSRTVMSIDTQLIDDGTYFVVE